MAKTEEYFKRIAVESSNDFCSKASKDAFSYCYLPWTKAKAAYLGIIGDVVYYNPDQGCLKENQSNWYVRCVGDGGALASLRGKYDDKLFGAVVQMLEAIDYETHYSATPINLINAYWLLKQNCELQ